MGLPGDVIQYKEKQLKVNDIIVTKSRTVDYLDPSTFKVSQQFEENFQDAKYTVLNDIGVVDFYFDEKIFKDHCTRIVTGFPALFLKNIILYWATIETTVVTVGIGALCPKAILWERLF